ncbi:MAG: NAD(P)-binding domain-containing protein [Bacteroidales bacterium]|nr:NAD(P)-binding domain-containing protein [Bacteroidales bacterium]
MKKGKILFIDTAHPLLRQELVKDGFQCDAFPDCSRDELKKRVHRYTGIIIRSKIKLDKNFLENAGQLRFIGRVGAGMENIDTGYAQSKGITCLNAPEGNRDAVAEQAVGMLLALFNRIIVADKEVREGIWQREKNRGTELGGKTVGIIGYGNTGSAFAKKLSGFGVEVIAYDKYKTNYSDRFVTEVKMDDLFEQTDILSLHVPLTNETTYLVNDGLIKCFKKNIYLINTSRGKVVKTADLVGNLQNGKVKGACLDVLEYEGLSYESLAETQLPADFAKLVQLPNVVLSPHIAGWTHESNIKLAMTLVEKIRKLGLK